MNIYILAFFLLFTVASSSLLPGSHPKPKAGNAGPAKIVFKSTDGGQTWQDISKGLPENLRIDSIQGNSFFANDKGLFLRREGVVGGCHSLFAKLFFNGKKLLCIIVKNHLFFVFR